MDSGKEVSEVDSDFGDGLFKEYKKEEEEISGKEAVKVKDTEVTSNSSKVAEIISAEGGDVEVSQRIVLVKEKNVSAEQEEEEGKSEEDDVVENDVNLMYHYQTESEESGRCLSPVSEDSEHGIPSVGSIRRFSLPYVMRKDLNFYLGLRKDSNIIPIQMHRRQSLPTTAMYFHSSSGRSPGPRSLSMDALLSRPKISNLSPSLEMGFMGSGGDPLSFTPLKHQTLMLQGGSLTRFVSNPTSRRASCDPSLLEHGRLSTHSHLPSDLIIPPYKNCKSSQQFSLAGLASSWPNVARRSTTNGSTQHHAPSLVLSTQSVGNNKSALGFSSDKLHHMSTTSLGLSTEKEDDEVPPPAGQSDPSSPEQRQNINSSRICPQSLSLPLSSSSHGDSHQSRP